MPVNMIKNYFDNKIQTCLAEYSHNSQGIGKLKNYKVKLHINSNMKPIKVPPWPIPYHLKERASQGII